MTVVVTGIGSVILGGDAGDASPDPSAYLRVKKSRKFMGLQDDLAVIAAGRALASSGLLAADLGPRAGLYLSVGYIPFEHADIAPVLAGSLEEGRFSMRRFADDGVHRAHPLLTFRCLPNMPAFHVSANFDVQGPYLVTYPGAAQLYQALEEATCALEEGRVSVALVLGVSHQRNFLVEHHFGRLLPPVNVGRLRDAAGCLALETEASARARGAPARATLRSLSLSYAPGPARAPREAAEGIDPASLGELGPASLPVLLGLSRGGVFAHSLSARDGVEAESRWSLP